MLKSKAKVKIHDPLTFLHNKKGVFERYYANFAVVKLEDGYDIMINPGRVKTVVKKKTAKKKASKKKKK